MNARHAFFTSPWRGEVASRSPKGEGAAGGVNLRRTCSHPGTLRAPTLPLQGRVSESIVRGAHD
jgi:hypothetical protein